MSRNPNYTGNQTYTIPSSEIGLFSYTKAPMPRNGTNPKQDLDNQGGSLPDYIRPKNESKTWYNDYQPQYNPPTKVTFNLDTEAKRRSTDSETLLR